MRRLFVCVLLSVSVVGFADPPPLQSWAFEQWDELTVDQKNYMVAGIVMGAGAMLDEVYARWANTDVSEHLKQFDPAADPVSSIRLKIDMVYDRYQYLRHVPIASVAMLRNHILYLEDSPWRQPNDPPVPIEDQL